MVRYLRALYRYCWKLGEGSLLTAFGMLVGLLVVTAFSGYSAVGGEIMARTHPSTTGTVVAHSIGGGKGTSETITVEYQVDGRSFSREWTGTRPYTGPAFAVGDEVTVFYVRADPGQIFPHRTRHLWPLYASWFTWLVLLFSAQAALGLLVVVGKLAYARVTGQPTTLPD